MRSIKILSLATFATLAMSSTAFAQDAAADSASGKRFVVVGGVSLLQPKSDPAEGIDKFDGGPAPTLSASYYINDNFAVELRDAADKFNHRVRPAGGAKRAVPFRCCRQRVPSVCGPGLLRIEL